MADKVCKFLEEDEVKKFVDSMETFIFDCDGVLWNGVGVIDGAVEVLQELRKSGKRVFFVTNNSSKSRKDYANKLENFGIKVSKRKRVVDTSMKYFINKMNHYRTQVLQDQFEKGRVILASDWCQNWNRNSNAVEKARKTVDEIYGTSYAVAYYLKEILKFDKKVFTIGTTGMTQELDELGIPHTGSGPDQSTGGYNIKEWTHLTLDPEVGAVACGFDEHFSYHKLIKAASYLAKDTCLFIATNCDDRFPFNSTDIVIPGTGCLVISVETAARRKATVVGKPERIMFDCINSRHNIDPSKTCMIGDRLNTDILFGNNCGLKTVLVLTGISSLEDVKECQASNDTDDRNCIPDFYISSIDALRLPLNPLKHV